MYTGLTLATSSTVTADRSGRIQSLLFPTVAARGDRFHSFRGCFRFVSMFYNLPHGLSLGALIPDLVSPRVVASCTDVFAVLAIFFAARGPWLRYHGIPTLLKTILRDASVYFLSMFACQLLLLFFLFLAPVGRFMVIMPLSCCSCCAHSVHVYFQVQIQLLPGM